MLQPRWATIGRPQGPVGRTDSSRPVYLGWAHSTVEVFGLHARTLGRLGWALGLTLLLASGVAVAQETHPPVLTVVIAWQRPKPVDSLIGMQEMEVHVAGIPVERIRSVMFSVDGRNVATLNAPPWRANHDFGDEFRPRTLEAAVALVDGRVFKQARTVQPPSFTAEVDVPLVTMGVSVKERTGKPIRDLAKTEVSVYDSGNLVKIDQWEPGNGKLAIALVIDTSLSMRNERIESARAAATSMAKLIRPDDLLTLAAFSDEPHQLLPLQTMNDAVLTAIAGLQAKGGTALYDAVFSAARWLDRADPTARRVMVLLSDGRDESASGLEPGSLHTLQESIHEAHVRNVTVFSVGLGKELERETDRDGKLTTAEVLTRISQSTGGSYSPVTRIGRLETAFRDIMDELRSEYGLAYYMPKAKPGETWRKIQVVVRRPDVTIRTREGYYVR